MGGGPTRRQSSSTKWKTTITTCSFWAPHARVAIGKEKTNDTDGIVGPNYQEELGLLKQRSQRGALPESEGITVASLGTSTPVIMVNKEQSQSLPGKGKTVK